LPAIVLVIAGLGLVAMLVIQSLQIGQLRQRLDMLTRGADGASLEGVLDAHLELVHQVSEDLDELTVRTAAMEATARHHFAKIGLVRFNPFPDTGGNQSFALAMLDESDDGFIVSSLHSRTGTRIYAKAVTAGAADATLSAEETEAIDKARARKTSPVVAAPARTLRAQPAVAVAPARESAAYAMTDGAAPEAEARVEELDTEYEPLRGGGTRASAPSSRFRLPLPMMARNAAPADVEDVPAPGLMGATAPAEAGPESEAEAAAAGPVEEASVVSAPEPVSVVAPSGDTTGSKPGFKGQNKGETVADDAESAADSERTGRRTTSASVPGPQSEGN
jgi:hypothetical protein